MGQEKAARETRRLLNWGTAERKCTGGQERDGSRFQSWLAASELTRRFAVANFGGSFWSGHPTACVNVHSGIFYLFAVFSLISRLDGLFIVATVGHRPSVSQHMEAVRYCYPGRHLFVSFLSLQYGGLSSGEWSGGALAVKM